MSRTRSQQRGFTLIEVMIAMAILALMMAIAWGTTTQTVKAKKRYEKVQERYREVRVAMGRITHDLASAYISGNEDRTLMDPRTFFIGEPSGDVDSLRFSTFAHTPLYADANESDQTIVSYSAAPDREDSSRQNLLRRETKRLASNNERWDALPATTEVIFPGVSKLELTYWDWQAREWKDNWSTQNTGGALPRLPDRVRIKLTFEDELDKEISFVTEVRLELQEIVQK